jgi:hypothetical protein
VNPAREAATTGETHAPDDHLVASLSGGDEPREPLPGGHAVRIGEDQEVAARLRGTAVARGVRE